MSYSTQFTAIPFDQLVGAVSTCKEKGWRYVQTLAVNCENGIDLIYSFMDMETGLLENYKVESLPKGTVVPSITDYYLEAFVWENEIHDLFGVPFEGIAIDFHGTFYALATPEPMTVISPEQKAAREKAAKIAAAKAAKEEKSAGGGEAPAKPDDMEAKLAGMDPEKAAKVRAAMEAKAAKAKAAEAAALEEKLAGMDPEKAAKVRAAMEAKAAKAKKEEK